ncbi:hypothetical protein VTI74DRAFT_3088 [Chaetomium olivicolor]
MIGAKRARPETKDDREGGRITSHDQVRPWMPPPPKRRRVLDPAVPNPATPPKSGRDLLSPLSDELLLRILSFLSLQHLVGVAPVSRRFYHLSSDSQLWKALYYARFVLPRAMRIPGFREGGAGGGGAGHKLHYSGRRTVWADGRRGGVVPIEGDIRKMRAEQGNDVAPKEMDTQPQPVNWKRQYKIRYNWARGKCAVEELKLGGEAGAEVGDGRKMLVKVVEGVAVTADKAQGLRAWDLKSRSLIAQLGIGDGDPNAAPSCIAVDEAELERGILDMALGFDDGSFGLWRLSIRDKRLERRYRHEKSSNGELIAMAFSYPYLLTATGAVLVSLYTFEVPSETEAGQGSTGTDGEVEAKQSIGAHGMGGLDYRPESSVKPVEGLGKLPPPYLLTSLDSYTSRPPLALSIRRAGKSTIASVAYTFSTIRGWSIGIQDLHIRQPSTHIGSAPEITTTRIAYTTPVQMGGVSHRPPSPPATPHRGNRVGVLEAGPTTSVSGIAQPVSGPTTLCYTHPYLLAALPDNTLVLHMCTSNASSLSISDGIRLWGHTSGISDAEITARGKAVSVSTRGEEMRVWELEGRSSGVGSRSVEIRPWQCLGRGGSSDGLADEGLHSGDPARDWDERRNWVGFDDEMVIVLKERTGARESLMVYDFT